MNRTFFVAIFAAIGMISACATQRPVLYPNERLRRGGDGVAERDIDECMQRAEEYVASNSRVGTALGEAASRAATDSAVGAAAGAAGGAVVGRAATGAAVGAAGGGAAGATRGLIHGMSGKRMPSPIFRNFVNRCLREKGYDPIGWN